MISTRFARSLTATLFALPLASVSFGTPVVWNGPIISFAKPASADETLAQNQDRITNNAWLTRAAVQGLFNIKNESSYMHNLSPSDTEWALGTTANYLSLTYPDWETRTGGIPNVPNIVGRNAVVHLITDDIYLDLKFTAWGVGSLGGGSFSYDRSTAAVPEPGSLALLGVGAFLLSSRRRR